MQQAKYFFTFTCIDIHDNLVKKVKQIHQKTRFVFSASSSIKSAFQVLINNVPCGTINDILLNLHALGHLTFESFCLPHSH